MWRSEAESNDMASKMHFSHSAGFKNKPSAKSIRHKHEWTQQGCQQHYDDVKTSLLAAQGSRTTAWPPKPPPSRMRVDGVRAARWGAHGNRMETCLRQTHCIIEENMKK